MTDHDHAADPFYQALKGALALAATPYERDSVQAVITNLRHECACADPDSPLRVVEGVEGGRPTVTDLPAEEAPEPDPPAN